MINQIKVSKKMIRRRMIKRKILGLQAVRTVMRINKKRIVSIHPHLGLMRKIRYRRPIKKVTNNNKEMRLS